MHSCTNYHSQLFNSHLISSAATHWISTEAKPRESCFCVTAPVYRQSMEKQPHWNRTKGGRKKDITIVTVAQELWYWPVVAEWGDSGRHSQCVCVCVAFIILQPSTDHCASILQPRRWVCLPSASFERHLSKEPPRRSCAAVLNTFKTLWRPWHPWRCLNILCTTFELFNGQGNHSASYEPPISTWVVLW